MGVAQGHSPDGEAARDHSAVTDRLDDALHDYLVINYVHFDYFYAGYMLFDDLFFDHFYVGYMLFDYHFIDCEDSDSSSGVLRRHGSHWCPV